MKMRRFISILLSVIMLLSILSGCSLIERKNKTVSEDVPSVGNLRYENSMELEYAENFGVDYYEGGYALISISDGTRYLVVPEDKEVPEGLDSDIAVLQQPITNIYLVATSAMALFRAIDGLDAIRLSGTNASAWYIEEAVAAMDAGDILFAGKYSQPDYELIVSEGCTLAVESGMINHTPEVQEKLEELGITVMVDQSSYESHPLARTEWLKLYSVLLDKEKLAQEVFNEQTAVINESSDEQNTGKTVAFFYINSSGSVVVRKSSDYVPKMIEFAGGTYIFNDIGDPEKATSTLALEMEQFYSTAKDADYIIYNSTIGGELKTIEDLIAKNELLADFKAVQEGNVWCTCKNLFQATDELGSIIGDIKTILTTKDKSLKELTYTYKLQ